MVEQTKRLRGKRYVEKADATDKAKSTAKKSVAQLKTKKGDAAQQLAKLDAAGKAKPRNGMIVEVVVPLRSKITRRSRPASPVSSPAEDRDEDVSSVSSTCRISKRTVIEISDDDEAAQSEAVSDDYQPSSKAQSSDEMDVDGEEKSKKAKNSAKAKAIRKAASDSEDVDAMDVDDVPKKAKGKTSKRKTPASSDNESTKRPAKKTRVESDSWQLNSEGVQGDWTKMRAPPLEMFYFARVVVDEYTYLEGKVLSMVTHLAAERQWVLSGTPPLSDFGAIKTISAFLGVHLGIDDDGEGESAKKRKREQTGESS